MQLLLDLVLFLLEGTACYAGLLLAPVEGLGRGFFALGAKKEHFMLFLLIFGVY